MTRYIIVISRGYVSKFDRIKQSNSATTLVRKYMGGDGEQ